MKFDFNTNNPYSYMKYAGYKVEEINKNKYIVPQPNASIEARNVYDLFSKIDSVLVELLNVGKICIENENENVKLMAVIKFVEQYGLLGFMADSPINPDFLLDKEVILKEDNVISNKHSISNSNYFKMFFPLASDENMAFSIINKKIEIESNSMLQNMLKNADISNQLIYSEFYCEKVEWIIEYATKMYALFCSIVQLLNSENEFSAIEEAKELISKFVASGVSYTISVYGLKPEITWQPNSLKQALELVFGFFMCSDKNPIKMCKHCGKVFLSKNPKAEYCSPQCRNQANVYKSRAKSKE